MAGKSTKAQHAGSGSHLRRVRAGIARWRQRHRITWIALLTLTVFMTLLGGYSVCVRTFLFWQPGGAGMIYGWNTEDGNAQLARMTYDVVPQGQTYTFEARWDPGWTPRWRVRRDPQRGVMSVLFCPAIVALPLVLAAGATLAPKPRDLSRCRSCGYTLAGLRAGAPCPECGEVPRRDARSANRV